jgi:hypothetical protein
MKLILTKPKSLEFLSNSSSTTKKTNKTTTYTNQNHGSKLENCYDLYQKTLYCHEALERRNYDESVYEGANVTRRTPGLRESPTRGVIKTNTHFLFYNF